jgi:hypothetical protein
VALISDTPYDLQILLNTAVLYSQKHHYTLQPQKSVIIPVNEKLTNSNKPTHTFRLNGEEMPNVDKSSHLGIIRSTSRLKTENATIDQNITKARRASYSLMSAGLHGDNGLDPVTSISIMKTYILPILTYSLEVLQPRSSNIHKLEQFQKSILKRILSLPKNAPDPVLYIISGILPTEAQIDIKCLTLFNNIARQPEDAIENLLAKRQLNIKENNSTSWFITIKEKLYKYNLPNPLSLLDSPLRKNEWKNTVKKAVEKHWKIVILENCNMYNSFNYLHCDVFQPNKIHHLIQIDNTSDPSVEAVRIAVKLKLVNGTYNLQVRAAKFRSANTRICELCNEEDEDIEHFLLGCQILQCVRAPFLNELADILQGTYSK